MSCFLFITQGEVEEKLSIVVYQQIKNFRPEVKIFFFTLDEPGRWQKKGFAEIETKDHSLWYSIPRLKKQATIYHALKRRRKFTEEIVLWSDNPFFLLPLFLLTGKKAIFVPVVKNLKFSFSFWHIAFLRFFSSVVLTTDRELVHNLRQKNIPAYFVGNLLADLLPPSEFLFLHGEKPIYALFPREEKFSSDLKFFLDLVERIFTDTKAYFISAIPGKIKTAEIANVGEEKGWRWRKSLEGDIIEGYLERGELYLNLTRFREEALWQSDLVVSPDDFSIIQATGIGKKVLPVSNLNPEEAALLLRSPQHLFEYNQLISSRYGRKGGIEKISAYLLQGVVKDQNFLK